MNKQFNLTLVLAALISVNVYADTFNNFGSTHLNSNPFVDIHRLPGFSGSKVLAPGVFQTRINVNIANEFHQDAKENEAVLLDFERTTINLGFRYGMNDLYTVGVNIPYFFNSGGFLDNWIENWHDVFSLPQGGRDQTPQDKFRIRYQNGADIYLVDDKDNGVGDVSLFVERQFVKTKDRHLKAVAGLKLPTGDEQQLFGSDGYGVSLSAHATQQFSDKWTGFTALGLNYIEQGDGLFGQQENLVGSAVIGLSWQLYSTFGLSAQLDFNSSVYKDTDLEAISGQGGALFLAAQYQLANGVDVQFGFTEDVINKDAVPDFAIRLGIEF